MNYVQDLEIGQLEGQAAVKRACAAARWRWLASSAGFSSQPSLATINNRCIIECALTMCDAASCAPAAGVGEACLLWNSCPQALSQLPTTEPRQDHPQGLEHSNYGPYAPPVSPPAALRSKVGSRGVCGVGKGAQSNNNSSRAIQICVYTFYKLTADTCLILPAGC